jgi:hypothetical protein
VTGTGFTLGGTAASNYVLASSTLTATGDITPRPITATADPKTKVYGDNDPPLTYAVSSGPLASGDSFSGSLTRDAGDTVGSYAIKQGTLTAGSNYDLTYVGKNLTITKAELTVTADNKTRQYTDSVVLTASFTGFKNSETLATSGVTGSPSLTTTATAASTPATYPITAAVGSLAATNYSFKYVNGVLTVTKEDALIDYTGDTIGLTGSTGMTLRATVWDSAAAGSGFTGDSTIGDITKMFVQFDVYSGTSCGAGAPSSTQQKPVVDTGTLGDGIGTASATYTSSSEASYCIVAKLVGSTTANSVNAWYTANNAQSAVVTFYNDTGQFVTGGGWISDVDPNNGGNGHGNFGFNARFNKSGAPQGQMVYVYRGLYNGVLSDFRIKSNSLTSLGFACWNAALAPPAYGACPVGNATFPAKATLEGKSTIQINRASDGSVLFSDGNSTFSATVTDSGQSSGIGVDAYQLRVYDKNGVLYKQIGIPTPELLKGGNVVIHGNVK